MNNKTGKKEELINDIENKYLDICLKDIELNDMDACKNKYIEMVENLIERFLIWA